MNTAVLLMKWNPNVSRYTLMAKNAVMTPAAMAVGESKRSRVIRKSIPETSATYIRIDSRIVRTVAPKRSKKSRCRKK
jgi:hypothetical protein